MAKLDFHFSVFNNHINNAHDRAMEYLKTNSPEFVDEIETHNENGIMGIFEQAPTPATKRYVELVMQYVNENEED